MKKMISVVLAAALVLSLAVGCSDKKNDDNSNSQISSTTAAYDADGCTALLDDILYYEAGSAGSSLKAVIVAVDILNWTEVNQAGQEQISATVKDYLNKLSDEKKSIFKENFEIIDSYVDGIVDNDSEVIPLIDDAGADKKFDIYSENKYDVFADALEDELDKIVTDDNDVNNSNFDKEDCIELMCDIANVNLADSSLKQIHVAAEMIDFIIDCRNCTETEIKTGVKESYDSLDADTKKKFESNVSAIVDHVNRISNDVSLLVGIDDDADMTKFASDKYNAFLDAVEAETGLKLN